jgi:hypothetical protein
MRLLCPLAALAASTLALVIGCGSHGGLGDGPATSNGASTGPAGSFGGASSSGGSSSGGTPFVCAPDAKNAEIEGNNCDDDADGKVDVLSTCDGALAADGDAQAFAKALGLCEAASGAKGWGLVSATYTKGFNQTASPRAQQHGILSKFGNVIKPREGSNLGVLSTGFAREFDGNKGTESFKDGAASLATAGGSVPPGFPKPADGCEQDNTTNDVIDVKLVIKAPPNATGFKFDFNFYSSEWPEYVCSPFNDSFIAYLTAQGFNGGKADNVSFDSKKNPVSVNNGFFDRCTPNAETGCAGSGKTATAACPGGPSELGGTGFGIMGSFCGTQKTTSGGATGWLTSSAPVNPNETFTLEFMIWNTGDESLDSSVLLDNFRWVGGGGGPVVAGTERPAK